MRTISPQGGWLCTHERLAASAVCAPSNQRSGTHCTDVASTADDGRPRWLRCSCCPRESWQLLQKTVRVCRLSLADRLTNHKARNQERSLCCGMQSCLLARLFEPALMSQTPRPYHRVLQSVRCETLQAAKGLQTIVANSRTPQSAQRLQSPAAQQLAPRADGC